MKVLHFGACVGISVVTGLVFGVDTLIAANTHATEVPVWTQSCTLHRLRDKAELLCNDYQHLIEIDSTALQAIVPTTITCKAYPTHSIFGNLDVECDEPPAGNGY